MVGMLCKCLVKTGFFLSLQEVQKDGLILMFIFLKKTYAIGFNWTISVKFTAMMQ